MASPRFRLRCSLVTRRQFLDALLQAGGIGLIGMFSYPAARFLWGREEEVPESVRLAGAAGLPPGEGKLFKYGHKPALLVRTREGEWRAFSAICTHLECTVQYEKERSRIRCACHEGMYDLQGNNIAGPPPEPLSRYAVRPDGDDLIISVPGRS
jgi:Rieske Fe-S protein